MENSASDESSNTTSHDRPVDGSTSGSSQPSGPGGDDDLNTIREQLTLRETKAVLRMRLMVIAILVVAATALSVTVYYITKHAEKAEFESQYDGVADKIVESFEQIFVEMGAVSGLGVAASAHSVDHKSDWPFVTLSNFQQRAGNARALAGTLLVQIAPLVQADQRDDWEAFVADETNNYWVDEGFQFQEARGVLDFADPATVRKERLTNATIDPMHTHDKNGQVIITQSDGPYLPVWQSSPVIKLNIVNENLLEVPFLGPNAVKAIEKGVAILGGFVSVPAGLPSHPNRMTALYATLRSTQLGHRVEHQGDPMAYLDIPIFDTFDPETRKPVAAMTSTIHWLSHFKNILPSNVKGLQVVLHNDCSGHYTYELQGSEAIAVGYGDLHDSQFNEYKRDGFITVENLDDGTLHGVVFDQEGCHYSISVYPTEKYYDIFSSTSPALVTSAVAFVFAFTILMFLVYDRLVERRQKLVLTKATQSTAIVSSLFPKQVRDRLMATEQEKHQTESKDGSGLVSPNQRLRKFLNGNTNASQTGEASQTIADLFPNCTVFFADISGFTAWSSTREPAQVFTLLQTVYQAFDVVAKRRRVFKVETIGDSYVAATGLPEPQAHHATIMAKFAWDCLAKFGQITRELEIQLGPETADLGMRFGLHSGAVTAGVLKGDRARFQLFGDTVNTASRMESTGRKGRIQVSQSTADILSTAGKAQWLTPRDDAVKAKGKGVLNTFWLSLYRTKKMSGDEDIEDASNPEEGRSKSKIQAERLDRLVEWTVDVLLEHAKRIVNARNHLGKAIEQTDADDLVYFSPEGTICLDEVMDSIPMPPYDAKLALAAEEASEVVVPAAVLMELRAYVVMISKSYRYNAFHNFEHACHVTMSTTKILKRIVAPPLSSDELLELKNGVHDAATKLHRSSHGITSDPMACFALTFAALVHNVDHHGVSNSALSREESEMAKHYRNTSVAEQHSVDVAWDKLMSDQFRQLRKYVFGSKEELMRFRHFLVNMVLATDFCDKELAEKRRTRWDLAFSGEEDLQVHRFSDYRATVVMEFVVQAADISHCLQHWHVYQKWNHKLFLESYEAFQAGRSSSNPVESWYEGELKFFDNVAIPLAKKLIVVDTSGVNGDEFLNYAMLNRAEWEDRGKAIVEDFVREMNEADECWS